MLFLSILETEEDRISFEGLYKKYRIPMLGLALSILRYADDIYSRVYDFYILYDTSYKKNHDNLVKIHMASLRLFSKYPIVKEEYLLLKAALEKILEDINSSEGFLLLEPFYTYSDIGLH